MAEVGNPERSLRGALVGGTNGKGSVVAMARSVLSGAGLRVGTMPKPHLVTYRERIAIDGEPITSAEFAAAVERVLPAIDRVAAEVGPPTEFEALTAAAIIELARRGVDLAIVEVGMGGRLDATNVLDLGVAAVTNVQRDHEAHLGHTLTAIGGEKAPIIKRGNLAVTGCLGARPAPDPGPMRRAGRAPPPCRPAPAVSRRAPARRLGRDRGRRADALAQASTACGSGCWGHTRPTTRPWRWRCSRRWTSDGASALTRRSCAAEWRRRSGRDGWSCSTGPASASGASSSTAPTTRPAPRRSRGR